MTGAIVVLRGEGPLAGEAGREAQCPQPTSASEISSALLPGGASSSFRG